MARQVEWEPIAKELAELIEKYDWSENFAQAIHDAKKANVPDLDNIETLDDYLNEINRFLFWKPTENERGDVVYNKICLFYWILDQPTLLMLQTQILPKEAVKPLTILSNWIVSYANALGAFYGTPQSIDEATLKTFYDSPAYNMDQYEPPPSGWKTFNEFFARHVKPGYRDPEEPLNPEVIVSAADSVYDGQHRVNDENNVFFVKGIPWNIKQLLSGSDYANAFEDGIFMHAFLNTTDYHRQHAPIMGRVVEAKVIPGAAYLEVVPAEDTSPIPPGKSAAPRRNRFAMRRRLALGKTDANIIRHVYQGRDNDKVLAPVEGVEAPDNPGYQFLQARGCVVIDSPIGLVAVLPVGMAQVSSVRLSVKKGDEVKKGQEISYFQFGGSDIVMVFEKGSQVDLTAVEKQHYNTGRKIGTAKVPTIQ